MAEDLADLFELELDKLANQYEMQQRAEQQNGDQKIDALAEKLKEVARRQQQEVERRRRLGAGAQATLDGWRQVQERLQQNQGGRAERDVQDALRRAQELSNEQREVAS